MNRKRNVSPAVIRRLPRYHRFLGELLRHDVGRISSKELAERMNLTASQIRQDLNCFGGFGQQGYGYNVSMLHSEIGKILGLERGLTAIMVGVGNLGHAFANHIDFLGAGFRLSAIFDKSPSVVGQTISGLTVMNVDDMPSFCAENRVDVAVLCVPKEVAGVVADQLIACGVKAYWNFTYYDISVGHPELIVENAHLSDGLMTLCFRINAFNQEPLE